MSNLTSSLLSEATAMQVSFLNKRLSQILRGYLDFFAKDSQCKECQQGVYFGELKGKVPHGKGTMVYLSGEIYTGEFKGGLRNGYGKHIDLQGNVYKGKWESDDLVFGKISKGYFMEYEGQVCNCRPHGFGKHFSPEGVYIGYYKSGQKHGFGKLFKTSCSVLAGEFFQDQFVKHLQTKEFPSGNEKVAKVEVTKDPQHFLTIFNQSFGIQHPELYEETSTQATEDFNNLKEFPLNSPKTQHFEGANTFVFRQTLDSKSAKLYPSIEVLRRLTSKVTPKKLKEEFKPIFHKFVEIGSFEYTGTTPNKTLYFTDWTFSCNCYYKGEVSSSGKRWGKGIEVSKDQIYQGNWRNNKRSGQGKLVHANGSVYEGNWVKDSREGFGSLAAADYKYFGNWKRNAPEGLGTEVSKTEVYTGNFLKGHKHGRGKLVSENYLYIGDFEKDAIQGKGVLVWKNSKVYVGRFLGGSVHSTCMQLSFKSLLNYKA